jgi:hypothetical protein
MVGVLDVGIGAPDAALNDDSVFFSRYFDRPIKSFTVRRNERTTVVTGTAKGWGRTGGTLVIQLAVPCNLGAHDENVDVAPADVPVIDDLADAILEYLYRAPAKLAAVRQGIEEGKRG